MAEEVVIVGAGGHGRVCLDICLLTDTPLRGFLDSGRDMGEQIHGVPVLGGDELLSDAGFRAGASFIVGIGDRHIRPRVIAALDGCEAELATLVHPSAVASPRSVIGAGTLVNAGAVVNTDTKIGRHCVLNTSCSVDHDCNIGDGCQVCPGATLAGGVTCGRGFFIGSGAVVLPNRTVGQAAIIGAGSAVAEDVPEGVAMMNRPPLKKIK